MVSNLYLFPGKLGNKGNWLPKHELIGGPSISIRGTSNPEQGERE